MLQNQIRLVHMDHFDNSYSPIALNVNHNNWGLNYTWKNYHQNRGICCGRHGSKVVCFDGRDNGWQHRQGDTHSPMFFDSG